MQENVRRAVFFLRLATEQARIICPSTAARLNDHYIPEMLLQFDQAVATEFISPENATALNTLTREGDEEMAALRGIFDNAPLGFGGGLVTERSGERVLEPVANPYGVIGAERKRTISEQKALGLRNRLLAELVESSER